jgi:hypothetical protein
MAKDTAAVLDAETQEQRGSEAKKPFRASEFRRRCEEHIKANGLDPLTFDRHKFQREQGLPNPTRLYEVQAYKAGAKVESAESKQFEAVDPSEAINRYKDSFSGVPAEELKKTSVRFEVRIIAE